MWEIQSVSASVGICGEESGQLGAQQPMNGDGMMVVVVAIRRIGG